MNSTSQEALLSRFANWMRDVPVEELRQNARVWLGARLAELDLVPRAEFDQQVAALRRAEAKLAELEKVVRDLEAGRDAA